MALSMGIPLRTEDPIFPDSGEWLPRQDLNLDKQSQNLLCYRYTTRQWEGTQKVTYKVWL